MSTFNSLFPAIIPKECHKHIKEHKYIPGSQSCLMSVLNIWWEFVVTLVPLTIAPNAITLSALILQFISFGLYCYYEPNFSGTYNSVPFYLFHAFALFAYQTMDAIDGKQARRTNNSSPLGQLFDHGCDAFICTITVMVQAGVCGTGTNWQSLYILIMSQSVFYALNWRARHTQVFDFGYFSVDETMLLGSIMHIITAFYGTEFWEFKLFGFLTPVYFLLISLTGSIVYNCGKAFFMVYTYYNTESNIKEYSFKHDMYWECGNVFIFHLSLILWNTTGVYTKHPIQFVTICAFTFAHLVHRLIICDVTKMRSRKIQYIIIPIVIAGILSILETQINIKLIGDISMADGIIINSIWCWCTYIVLNYAIRCMLDISNVLEIRIFLINKPKIHSA